MVIFHSIKFFIKNFLANLAQLVEQLIRNEQVAGSIPAVGSKTCEYSSEKPSLTLARIVTF
jgi:hypothetical protein